MLANQCTANAEQYDIHPAAKRKEYIVRLKRKTQEYIVELCVGIQKCLHSVRKQPWSESYNL